VKGARRWIDLGFFQMQPSELAKPALVLVSAWLFAEHAKRPDLHANLIALALFLVTAGLLVAQPDIGQTMLVTAVWGCLFFVAGMSWLWIAVLGSAALGGLAMAYLFIPHVTSRIDRFLNPEAATTTRPTVPSNPLSKADGLDVGQARASSKSICLIATPISCSR
jgi:cell division protein FtsW